ncbi:MAG: hypothetical protein R3F17_14245 [Planctomycetota bacterium]
MQRLFVSEAYYQAIGKNLALLGFLSRLLTHSEVGEAPDGRELVTVEVARSVLAEDCGISLAGVRRFESALAKAGVVRKLRGSAISRVLEILPPPASPIRSTTSSEGGMGAHLKVASGAEKVVTGDHLPATTSTTLDCGKPVESPGKTKVVGGHPRAPKVVTGDHLALSVTYLKNLRFY